MASKKDAPIGIRLKAKHKEQLISFAEEKDMTVSELIRSEILQLLKRSGKGQKKENNDE